MQVSRTHLMNLGTTPPTSGNISLVPGGVAGGAAGGGKLTLNSFSHLNANDFQVSIPGASVTALMSDSNTKLLQNPQIRALDNEKATLKIGDRVPIATGSFQSGIGIGSVNTQFQYIDVGVNVDIVPHIHSQNEVTLKMVLEISSVTGQQNIGGVSQPIIGQRRIEHETRLQDGEVNLVGGILEDSESQSMSGYPWLTKIPILKYFFGQTDKERRENEIIFAITPHIIRAQDITDQNLRMVDVGTGNSVGIRHREVRAANAAAGTAAGAKNAATAQKNARMINPTNTPVAPVPVQRVQPTPVAAPAGSETNPVPTAQDRPLPAPVAPPPNAATTSPPVVATAPRVTNAIASRAPAPAPTEVDLPPLEPQVSATGPVASTSSSAVPATRPRNAQFSKKDLADPCPYGQHAVDIKKDVITCAFD
jgi:general secretion pathway protein D